MDLPSIMGPGTSSSHSVQPNGQDDHDAARVATPVGDLNHRCDGCKGGEPCPECGGNISTSHPAYRALTWAQQSTETLSDPFQRAVTERELVRSAPAHEETVEWGALETMMDTQLERFMASGDPFANVRGPAITPPPDLQFLVPWMDFGGYTRFIVVDPDPKKVLCCPALIYPIPEPLYDPVRQGPGWNLRWQFEFVAVYSNVYPCSCSCCVFRQYLDRKITGLGKGPDDKFLGKDGFHEAGEDSNRSKKSRFGRPGESPSCGTAASGESCEDYSKDKLPPKMSDAAVSAVLLGIAKLGFPSSVCIYHGKDAPGLLIGRGQNKTQHECFLGIVKSKCPPPCHPTAAQDSFFLDTSGRVDNNGNLVFDSHLFTPHAGCTVAGSDAPDCGKGDNIPLEWIL